MNIRTVQEPPTEDVVKLIHVTLILTMNNFSFSNEHYLQLTCKETAMGTCMAPSYANIFVDNLERQMLAKMDAVPSTQCRYIDDVFAIWPHGEEQLVEFLEEKINFIPLLNSWPSGP